MLSTLVATLVTQEKDANATLFSFDAEAQEIRETERYEEIQVSLIRLILSLRCN
jgi:hypothetical protein